MTRRRLAKGKPIFGGRHTSLPAFGSLLVMPTLLTMLVSGIWHGAGYTYVLWGLLHGGLLCVNHAWRLVRPRIMPNSAVYHRIMPPIGFVLTFLSVVLAMVMFRAPSVAAAVLIWKGMFGGFGITLPYGVFSRLGSVGLWLATHGVHPAWTSGSVLLEAGARISVLLAIALLLPNTLQIFAAFEPAIGVKPAKAPSYLVRLFTWAPNRIWAFGMTCMALAGMMSLGELSEFLYWQF